MRWPFGSPLGEAHGPAAGAATDHGSARTSSAFRFKSSSDLRSATRIDIRSIARDLKLNDRIGVIGSMNFAATT